MILESIGNITNMYGLLFALVHWMHPYFPSQSLPSLRQYNLPVEGSTSSYISFKLCIKQIKAVINICTECKQSVTPLLGLEDRASSVKPVPIKIQRKQPFVMNVRVGNTRAKPALLRVIFVNLERTRILAQTKSFVLNVAPTSISQTRVWTNV